MQQSLTTKKLILFIVALTVSTSLIAQQIGPEKVFFYYASLNNLTPENCIDQYASTFDSYNYNQANSDEFKRNKYREKEKQIISEGLKNINYNDKFVTFESARLGEYSFSDHSFPIGPINFRTQVNITSTKKLPSSNDVRTSTYYLNDEVINQKYFLFSLKMSENEASAFIASRKDQRGSINRNVTLRVTYSIINNPINKNNSGSLSRFKGYVYSIEFFGDNNKRIGILYPTIDFYDKVHGIKMKEGVDTIYHTNFYGAGWSSAAFSQSISGILPLKQDANYYRVVKYHEGKIREVKDFYMSGKLAMTGTYGPYSTESEYANGLFTWYYANGLKRQEVSYINGEMNGCFRAWESNGKCAAWSLFTLIRNGMPVGKSKDCGCKDQINTNLETVETSKMASDKEIKTLQNITSGTKSSNNKLLISSSTGNGTNTYLAGSTSITINKKTGTKENSDVLFLFDYKDGPNNNIKPEVKHYLINHFKDWIEKSTQVTAADLEKFREDSLFKIELTFTVRLAALKSLEAYITTRIHVTQNGTIISDESFERSRSLFLESNEPYTVLDNVIKNSEKKISKVLGEYLSIK